MTQPPETPSWRRNGIWLPLAIFGPLLLGAIAWGTNGNRLTNVEQQEQESKAERERMEVHLFANDQQLAVLKAQLQFISDQLVIMNAKLDRADRDRK